MDRVECVKSEKKSMIGCKKLKNILIFKIKIKTKITFKAIKKLQK